jgi:CubicO group peptidase (beta-lactamase class C family)/D-alanyl-D-alanine dipeptidase
MILPSRAWPVLMLAGAAVLSAPPSAHAQVAVGPREGYDTVADALTRFIVHEMADKRLPALSIALTVDSQVVWAAGFGLAQPPDSVPATAETIYRVGSVSKLLTDLAVMRLVQRGALDLDAPVRRYLPEFRPRNPFGAAVTLRQLMTHHAGLVREPPVGSYFDSTAPPLSEIVASLNATTIVYPPGTRYKYSNAALQVVGAVLERVTGEPFPSFLRRDVLDPLGMTHSAFFDPAPAVATQLAAATMWAADGRRFAAPTFRRNAPSGALYTSVLDLGRLIASLFADSNPVLSHAALERMWVPQFAPVGATRGNGLGFFVSRFQGHRRVGHDGAIYGFATTLAALPDDRVGVVVVTTLDGANTVTDRIADAALADLLARRSGEPLPVPTMTDPLPPGLARSAAGDYVARDGSIDLLHRGGVLLLSRDGNAVPARVRATGDTFTIDDATAFGGSIRLLPGHLVVDGDTFVRRPEPAPAPPPARWTRLLGEYGWGYETLFIFERGGRLHALIEWLEDDALTRVSDTVFAFPATSMYLGERVVFRGTRSAGGSATAAVAGGVAFPRRDIGPRGGGQLQVTPVRPVAELLALARDATPPAESGSFRASDLVDLAPLDSTLQFDIRYATTNNFLGSVLYERARAYLQRPAAEALQRVAHRLRDQGYGLLIHDAYRPWYVTKTFWDATPVAERWLVANPAQGSRHNRGCAVDLTLYDLRTGLPIGMGGTYDEVTERSYPDYPVATDLERWHRELLRRAMEEEGFTRIANEWWHFDYRDWRAYPILNTTFAELAH